MSTIREKLSLKALGYIAMLQGWLYTYLQSYYIQKNLAYADAFLEKFRSRREDPTNFSAQKKQKPCVNCSHLKGYNGRIGQKFQPTKDYNVHSHRFADGTIKIWCGYGCGFTAYKGDSNWSEGVRMLEQSSNTASSSEVVMWAIDRPGKNIEYVSKDPRLTKAVVTVQDKWGK